MAEVLELVIFDGDGNVFDRFDPYVSHEMIRPGVVRVNNSYHLYDAAIPDGGRFVIRPRPPESEPRFFDWEGKEASA